MKSATAVLDCIQRDPLFSNVHRCFACMYVYVPLVCSMSTEARSGHQISENWRFSDYRWLWATMRVLEIKPRSSGRPLTTETTSSPRKCSFQVNLGSLVLHSALVFALSHQYSQLRFPATNEVFPCVFWIEGLGTVIWAPLSRAACKCLGSVDRAHKWDAVTAGEKG